MDGGKAELVSADGKAEGNDGVAAGERGRTEKEVWDVVREGEREGGMYGERD